MQVVFVDYVIKDDGNVEVHVFILIQGSAKVVIFDVEGEEFCIGSGNGGVEEEVDCCYVHSGCACIM